MGKRISEDEIKWILSVESTEAQQKIHQLTKENKGLTAANKLRLQEMVKLEKQGQKESVAYKNLEKVINDNNIKIGKNKDLIVELTGRMKTGELTMSQLKNRAKDLQKQLDDTSKATNPEEYRRLEKQLKETHARMNELRGSAKNVHAGFKNLKQLIPTISFAAIIAGATALGKSSSEAALESEKSVQRLKFAVLNVAKETITEFDALKKQASSLMGIFDDEEIMDAETTMLNFGLSTQAIIELMPLMVDAAAMSGKSLEEMATAIDKGVHSGAMAKSALGQLGIMFKDTGDYVDNYSIIVKGLSKFVGGNTKALKDNWGEVQRNKIEWGEFKESLGAVLLKAIVPLTNGIVHLKDVFMSAMEKMAGQRERIAQGRLNDFKTFLSQEKDKISYINKEVEAEENVIEAKKKRIVLNAREMLKDGTSHKRIKELEKESEGLQQSMDNSSAYISKLKELGQELKNQKPIKLNLFEDPSDVKDPYKDRLNALDAEMMKEEILLKKKYSEGKATEEDHAKSLIDLQVKYLEKKRDLYKADSAEYNEYQNQLIDIEINKNIDAEAAKLKVISDSYNAIKVATDTYENEKRRELQESLEKSLITQEQFNSQSAALDLAIAEKRLQAAKDYAELINDAKYNSEAEKTKAVESATQAVNAANAAVLKAQEAISKNKLQKEKEHLEEVDKLRKELGLDKEVLSYKAGLDALKEKLKNAEASEKESADKIAAYKIGKAQEYAEMAGQFVDSVSKLVTSSHEYEAASLEAAKQRELTAAGNSSEARAAIEEEYAQKELDLKKKQADANMGIAIAQAIAEGAIGIGKIWAIEGVNPILAGLLTATLVGITATQIATAVQQRNVIKSTSLGSGSSGGSSGGSGRMVASGLEEGGSIDVVRAQDGKMYSNAVYDPKKRGYVDHPTVITGEGPVGKSREWIASNAAVDNPSIAPILAILDEHQKAGTIKSLDLNQYLKTNMVGYAAGGSMPGTTIISKPGKPLQPSTNDSDITAALILVANTMKKLQDEGIAADVSLTDFEKKQNLRNKARKIGSK